MAPPKDITPQDGNPGKNRTLPEDMAPLRMAPLRMAPPKDGPNPIPKDVIADCYFLRYPTEYTAELVFIWWYKQVDGILYVMIPGTHVSAQHPRGHLLLIYSLTE